MKIITNPFVEKFRGKYSKEVDELCDSCNVAYTRELLHKTIDSNMMSLEEKVSLINDYDKLFNELCNVTDNIKDKGSQCKIK